MRKLIVVLSILAISWTSCTKEKAPVVLTQKQVKQQIDSIMNVRNRELEQQGQKDLQSRLKIEVKVKADSIIQARLNPPKVVAAPKPAGIPLPQPQAILHKSGLAK